MNVATRTFLLRQTSPVYTVLWCMFYYWLLVMVSHSAWGCGMCIAKSLGVAAFVGCALNANSFAGAKEDSLAAYVLGSPFAVLRFFLIPFCVASYSAIVNTKKDQFTFLFPHDGPKPLTYSGIFALTLFAYACIVTVLHRYVLPDTTDFEAIASTEPFTTKDDPSPILPQ